MKKTLLLVALFLSGTLNACQCSDPPPVGPVEGQEQVQVVGEDASARSDARA